MKNSAKNDGALNNTLSAGFKPHMVVLTVVSILQAIVPYKMAVRFIMAEIVGLRFSVLPVIQSL